LRTILIAAVVVLVPIAPAGAVFLNGGTLHDWCLSKEVGDQEACLGYVVGVADALDAAPGDEAAGVARRRLCLPEVDAKMAVDAVKKYLLVHPPTGDGGTGADLVADALADAYPCP
jgi:Rap1a immunity proteins